MDKESVLIGNIWRTGDGEALQSHDPVYGHLLWEGRGASLDQVAAAIKHANEVYPEWANRPLEERITLVNNFKQILQVEKSQFAKIISSETGKPNWEAINEVESMINKIDASISAYKIRTGEQQQVVNEVTLQIRHKPLGVMAVIGPYNFPGHIPNGHIVPALLAGNCVLFKPSEFTPLVAIFMASYWVKAGLPANVFNVLNGTATAAQVLVDNPGVHGILFTGSYNTGSQIHRALAGQPGKLLALEMGGNNPLIISDIEDVDASVLMTILSSFLTSGQRCTCSRRLIVVDSRNAAHFLTRLALVTEKIDVNHYDASPQPFMSSVTRPIFAQKLLDTQESLLAKGAKVIVKMRLQKEHSGMLTPGLLDLTHVNNREDKEIFGPLLQVIRVKDFDSALAEANNTAYGLAAGLISKNTHQFHTFYNTVRAGIINWNRPTTGASSNAPFGGVGHSGNYRPGAFYTADSCAYPVASMETAHLNLPEPLPTGLEKAFS